MDADEHIHGRVIRHPRPAPKRHEAIIISRHDHLEPLPAQHRPDPPRDVEYDALLLEPAPTDRPGILPPVPRIKNDISPPNVSRNVSSSTDSTLTAGHSGTSCHTWTLRRRALEGTACCGSRCVRAVNRYEHGQLPQGGYVCWKHLARITGVRGQVRQARGAAKAGRSEEVGRGAL